MVFCQIDKNMLEVTYLFRYASIINYSCESGVQFQINTKKGLLKMLLAACRLLFASLYRDRREQEANSEQQEAKISQIQLKDNVSFMDIFISNP